MDSDGSDPQRASVHKRDTPFLSPSPGVAFDGTFSAPAAPDLREMAELKLPTPSEFNDKLAYAKAVRAWGEKIRSKFTGFVSPLRCSLFYRRPPHFKVPPMARQKVKDDFWTGSLAVETNLLNGVPSSEIDPLTRAPFVRVSENAPCWNATDIPAFPYPEMFNSYEEFAESAKRWFERSKESVAEDALPYSPANVPCYGFLEPVRQKKVFKYEHSVAVECKKKELKNGFKHERLALKLIESCKQARSEDQEDAAMGEWFDSPYVAHGSKLNSEAPVVPFDVRSFLSVADPAGLPVAEKEKVILSVVNCITPSEVTKLWGLFNDLREFEYLLSLCSGFACDSLRLIDPEFDMCARVGNEAILHGHRIFLSYYYFHKFSEFLWKHNFGAAAKILQSYVSSANEQIVLYFQVFEPVLIKWALTEMNETTVGLFVCILQIMYRYKGEFVERVLAATEENGTSLMNLISMYSPRHFGKLRFDILGIQDITLIYYDRFKQQRVSQDFTPLMVKFVGDLFRVNLGMKLMRKNREIDMSWIPDMLNHLVEVILEDGKDECGHILLQVCQFTKRESRARSQKRSKQYDASQLLSCLVAMLPKIPNEKPDVLANALLSLAALCSCKNSLDTLTKSGDIETVLRTGVTESVEVSNAFWKVVRVLWVHNITAIPSLLQSPLWREGLSRIFTSYRVDQTFGIFKTLRKLICVLVPPDAKVKDEVRNVGLIFMLTAVPDEIVAFLQLMCDNGFKPYLTAVTFMKLGAYYKEQAQIREFLHILSERKSCWQLVKKSGRKGHQLSAVSKPKFQRTHH